jgi:N-acetylglucosamine kinase-like BadF-type ATPase
MAAERRPRPAVLAVDGGASKADVVLVGRSGEVLGAARRAGLSNVSISMEGAVRVIAQAIGAAGAQAGVTLDHSPIAPIGVYCLAGADFPVDDRRISRAFARHGWSEAGIVKNDTFAVLRAGTDAGWGVAVVCGAGMNCVGLSPDGRSVRFPALGELSGDWAAGGGWIGQQALGEALRGRDGRGPRTLLERSVSSHFGMARPEAVMRAVHRGRLDESRLLELAPLVFDAAARGDGAARRILDRQADEVIAWAVAALRRLRLLSAGVDVILGGGIFRADDAAFVGRIVDGVTAVAPGASVKQLGAPPVVGAALMGLEAIGASAAARARLRASLSFERLDGFRAAPEDLT